MCSHRRELAVKARDHQELTAKPSLGTESERGPKGPLGAAGANGQDVPSKVVMVLLDVMEVGAQGVHFERLALLVKGMRGSAWRLLGVGRKSKDVPQIFFLFCR